MVKLLVLLSLWLQYSPPTTYLFTSIFAPPFQPIHFIPLDKISIVLGLENMKLVTRQQLVEFICTDTWKSKLRQIFLSPKQLKYMSKLSLMNSRHEMPYKYVMHIFSPKYKNFAQSCLVDNF